MKSEMNKLFFVIAKSNQNPRTIADDPNDIRRGGILITVCE